MYDTLIQWTISLISFWNHCNNNLILYKNVHHFFKRYWRKNKWTDFKNYLFYLKAVVGGSKSCRGIVKECIFRKAWNVFGRPLAKCGLLNIGIIQNHGIIQKIVCYIYFLEKNVGPYQLHIILIYFFKTKYFFPFLFFSWHFGYGGSHPTNWETFIISHSTTLVASQ